MLQNTGGLEAIKAFLLGLTWLAQCVFAEERTLNSILAPSMAFFQVHSQDICLPTKEEQIKVRDKCDYTASFGTVCVSCFPPGTQ